MGEASLRTHCPHSAGSRSSKLVEITLNTRPIVSSTLFISHGKLGERLGSVVAVVAVVVVWKVLVRLSPGVHHHIAQSSRHHRHGHRHCRHIVTGKSETVKNVFFTGFWIYLSCVPLLV